ncbi:hypothetical protein ACFXDJ_01575 [Streptomyces sp. NPDC059443]|uniref:hypothetical protein n=1 Tax=unclassified Streptomyces TaxID=2593676 RepID=UPI0036899470
MSTPVRTYRRSAALPTMNYRLPVSHGWAVLPDATKELGGLMATPPGFRARLSIGGARDIDEHTARTLAAVLAHSAGYRVHGTDPHGLAAVVGTLASLLGR